MRRKTAAENPDSYVLKIMTVDDFRYQVMGGEEEMHRITFARSQSSDVRSGKAPVRARA